MNKTEILCAIAEHEKYEAEDAEKERKSKRKQVSIDLDSVIAKEIKYQTMLLIEILHHLGGR